MPIICFFLLCEINEFELSKSKGSLPSYNLISRSAHVSCLTEYMHHIKSKVINYGLARTQRTKERGLHWQEDWHICILSIQSVCLYITPPPFFFQRKSNIHIMYMILMLNLKTYVTFWELLLIETLTISIRIKIKMKLNIAVLSVKLYRQIRKCQQHFRKSIICSILFKSFIIRIS